MTAVSEIAANAGERFRVMAIRALVSRAPDAVHVRVGDEDIELPASLAGVLLAAAETLQAGESVAVVSAVAEVSPAQAARLLGVSRQYVDRLVAAEVLPSRRLPRSAYRKIPVRAVLAHRETRERKRAGIRRIVEDAIAAGLKY